MSLFQIMDIAECLLQLDPVRSYPRRGAEQVAKTVRASAFRLLREPDEPIHSDPPPEDGLASTLVLPIRNGRDVIAELHLFVDGCDRLGEDELRLARWGARVFSRGIIYCDRLASEGGRRTGEGIDKVLDRAPLTPRERDVVALLVAGSSTRAIADKTGLTVSTVNTYLKRIFSKLGVHSRVQLIARMAGTDFRVGE